MRVQVRGFRWSVLSVLDDAAVWMDVPHLESHARCFHVPVRLASLETLPSHDAHDARALSMIYGLCER
jgi:hypothetical protein